MAFTATARNGDETETKSFACHSASAVRVQARSSSLLAHSVLGNAVIGGQGLQRTPYRPSSVDSG